MELDCLSLDSVHEFGKRWEARKLALNVLINNAGIFAMNGMVWLLSHSEVETLSVVLWISLFTTNL